MKNKHISFGAVLKRPQAPSLAMSHSPTLASLFQTHRDRPQQTYTLHLNRRIDVNISQNYPSISGYGQEEQMFDSWIEKQSMKNINKENMHTQNTNNSFKAKKNQETKKEPQKSIKISISSRRNSKERAINQASSSNQLKVQSKQNQVQQKIIEKPIINNKQSLSTIRTVPESVSSTSSLMQKQKQQINKLKQKANDVHLQIARLAEQCLEQQDQQLLITQSMDSPPKQTFIAPIAVVQPVKPKANPVVNDIKMPTNDAQNRSRWQQAKKQMGGILQKFKKQPNSKTIKNTSIAPQVEIVISPPKETFVASNVGYSFAQDFSRQCQQKQQNRFTIPKIEEIMSQRNYSPPQMKKHKENIQKNNHVQQIAIKDIGFIESVLPQQQKQPGKEQDLRKYLQSQQGPILQGMVALSYGQSNQNSPSFVVQQTSNSRQNVVVDTDFAQNSKPIEQNKVCQQKPQIKIQAKIELTFAQSLPVIQVKQSKPALINSLRQSKNIKPVINISLPMKQSFNKERQQQKTQPIYVIPSQKQVEMPKEPSLRQSLNKPQIGLKKVYCSPKTQNNQVHHAPPVTVFSSHTQNTNKVVNKLPEVAPAIQPSKSTKTSLVQPKSNLQSLSQFLNKAKADLKGPRQDTEIFEFDF